MAPHIISLDHFVLTVRDIGVTVDFYERVLGMRALRFADGSRTALAFGRQKINLHQLGSEHLPNARASAPGSADVCFIVAQPVSELVGHLTNMGIDIEHGPDQADGARGPLRSIWIRDPDGNLIELANRRDSETP